MLRFLLLGSSAGLLSWMAVEWFGKVRRTVRRMLLVCMVVAWMSFLVVACIGCLSVSRPTERFLVSSMRPVPSGVREFELIGSMTWERFALLMGQEYGVQLLVPGAILDTEVHLPGRVDEDGLRRWLEVESGCQVVDIAGRLSLECGGQRFAIMVPLAFGGKVGGVKIEEVSGYGVAGGAMAELGQFRRLAAQLVAKRKQVRVRILIIDESVGSGFGARFDAFSLEYRSGLVVGFEGRAVVDLFRATGSVVSEFEVLVSDGVETTYRDTVEERFQVFVAGDQGRTFQGGFEVVTAGLDVTLRAVMLRGMWRVVGTVSLSDFRGQGGGIPARVVRSVEVDLDVVVGSLVRLAAVSVRRRSVDVGVRSLVFGMSRSVGLGRFGVWLSLEDVGSMGGGS